jgi:hypothetical protein
LIPVIQPGIIDVTDWPEDPEHPRYPEGAREKSALFPPDIVPFDFIKPGRRYLFKLSDQRYPEQFWAETIAYVVGCLLDVEVPPAYIAEHRGRAVCGALIEWFFVDGEQTFIAGGNRLQRLVPDYDRKLGTQHSFQLVQRACVRAARHGLIDDWLLYWGRAFLFDALIGNTDRHQDNWGFLAWTLDDGATTRERLSPLFDNGTSLGMERHLEHVAGWDDNKCAAYLRKGCHHMKLNGDDAKRCQHFDMIRYVVEAHPTLLAPLRETLALFSVQELEQRLIELCKLELPVKLTEARIRFTLRLVNLRYRQLCAILS